MHIQSLFLLKEAMEETNKEKVLILGITGMLGHQLFNRLSANGKFSVFGSARSIRGIEPCFDPDHRNRIFQNVDAVSPESFRKLFADIRPDVVINCIGIIKQLPAANDPLTAIGINSLFPHQVAHLCKEYKCRLIHVSTDCVFSGKKGNYSEHDPSDAEDLYGRTKYLGEVSYPHSITLRTSIIGHELKGKYGLIEWFLAQDKKIRGYRRAIFSGFPTIELARIISDVVIPDDTLNGLYHVSSEPISKFDLLTIVAGTYRKNIEIEPYDGVCENRSLDSSAFRNKTGYEPPSWEKLIDNMYRDYINCRCYRSDD